ncbi:hypothetical protein GOV14_00400 [Candidatus Pacearchaeota archaeon]|nr:hypothetical protein [Candidatus Pacearchaeota archaeon]
MRSIRLFVLIFLATIFSVSFVYAWELNGTTYDVNGVFLNNSVINVTISAMDGGPPTVVGYNATTSNATGWFNLSVADNSTWFYKIVITHANATTGAIDSVGQALPDFPYMEMEGGISTNFYLKEAGTINLTAVNATGSATTFNYMIKDQKLGYDVASNWNSYVSNAVVYLPKDRNYSIMIFPNQSMPISYNWDNFSASSSYTFADSLSSYNATTSILNKQFNVTETMIRVSGYVNNAGVNGWEELVVIPYLLEPGNMIFTGQGGFPYNMSAWNNGESDFYNTSTGFYNITLPGSVEGSNYVLFATAKNSSFYGGFRNVSLDYGTSAQEINFTMYGLFGSLNNITLNDGANWSNTVTFNTSKQQFNLVNATDNATLSGANAHIEVTVDYSDYGALEFTFMEDLSSGAASFYIPLINATGTKEINVYSMSFAPKRVGELSVSDLSAIYNISMKEFSPGEADAGESIALASVNFSMFISNSTCDVPNSPAGCMLASFAPTMDAMVDEMLPLVLGGGQLSSRIAFGGVTIHYVNVDLLASGPPDADFDSVAAEATSGSFSGALKFGSQGPTVYDYVLVAIPYTQGSTAVAGLNESEDVNLSIPLLYDEDWNVIWNTATNGTSGTNLAGNYSHYNEDSSEWATLLGNINCTENVSLFNSTNPCYIDKTNNKVWVRLPHFSGTKPTIAAGVTTVVTDDPDDPDDSSSGSPSGATVRFWTLTHNPEPGDFGGGYVTRLGQKHRVQVTVDGAIHYVGVVYITTTTATINVSSTPQQASFVVGDEKKFDVTDDNYYDISVKMHGIKNSQANVTIKHIHELMPDDLSSNTTSSGGLIANTNGDAGTTGEDAKDKKGGLPWWAWVLIALGILIILAGMGFAAYFFYFKKKKKR